MLRVAWLHEPFDIWFDCQRKHTFICRSTQIAYLFDELLCLIGLSFSISFSFTSWTGSSQLFYWKDKLVSLSFSRSIGSALSIIVGSLLRSSKIYFSITFLLLMVMDPHLILIPFFLCFLSFNLEGIMAPTYILFDHSSFQVVHTLRLYLWADLDFIVSLHSLYPKLLNFEDQKGILWLLFTKKDLWLQLLMYNVITYFVFV